jgi:hypothetical protein
MITIVLLALILILSRTDVPPIFPEESRDTQEPPIFAECDFDMEI